MSWQSPLEDVSGAEVGDLIILSDISGTNAAFRRFLAVASGGAVVLLVVLLGFLYVVLRRTDRSIRAQEADLRKSEAFQRALSEALPDFVFILDDKGTIQRVNRVQPGHREEDVVGKNVTMFLPPEYHDAYEKAFRQARETGRLQTIETMVDLPDGRHHFLSRLNPTRLAGEQDSVVLISTDITERKRAEERLRASEERYRVLFESSRDALMTVAPPSWKFTSGNPAAVALYGVKDEEQLTSLGPWDVSPEFQPDGRPSAEKAKEMIETAMREGSNFFEWTHKQLDGQEFPATVLLARVELRGETFLQGMVRDITERKRAEEESRETNRLLEEQTARANEMTAQAESANQAKSEFLANMSHEIRTPMTAILGFAEQLREPDITPSDRNNHVAVIERNARHLLDLINDILDLSKIEAGKLTIELIPSGVAQVVAEIAGMMHVRAAQKGLLLAVEYAGEIPETILTDPSRLRQALVNLVGNAIKFTDKGSIRIVSTFLPQWRHKQAAMQFQVIDTGIGMSREKLDKLFKPFVQADASTSRRYGGTGLGLTITRHIAGLLGGELTIESFPGEGTTCTLVVPTGDLDGVKMLTNPAEAVQDEDSSVSALSSGDRPLSDLRVLLAEDGHDNQLLIATVLRKAGAEVTIAENGRIAVEKATVSDTNEFDAILMDMQMPEMDGYQATRALRTEGVNCPIIALTAHAMSGDRDKCLDAGCTDYCSKPIDRNRLVATISTHTKRRRTGAEETGMPCRSDTGDAKMIRSEFADDPDMADILDDFVAHLPERLSAMTEALANNHHEELTRLAHQLKGAGGGYGYPSLTEASRELEEAANSRDTEAAKLLLGKLSALVCAVLAGREASVHP